MAGDVVNWTFYLASTFVVYWQFCAPKSATAPSAKPLAAIFAQKYFILLENCNKLKRKKYLDYERRRMIRWSNFQRDFAESYTFKAKNRLKFA